MSPDVAFSCTGSGWTWPGAAQYLPLLAPCLAPQNLISFANVRSDRTQYRLETDLTTQRDGRIRENARRPADLGGGLVAGRGFRIASERSDLCASFFFARRETSSHRAGNSAAHQPVQGLLPAKSKLALAVRS